MIDWIKCQYCKRWMHKSAKTCGNYCEWERLVGRA